MMDELSNVTLLFKIHILLDSRALPRSASTHNNLGTGSGVWFNFLYNTLIRKVKIRLFKTPYFKRELCIACAVFGQFLLDLLP